MPRSPAGDVVIIGAGIAGVATAYYLTLHDTRRKITLVDPHAPMSFTSAQSGENYRNWWPHPLMTQFVDHSIDLLEGIVCDTDNRISMTHRGYALATRNNDIGDFVRSLHRGFGTVSTASIREHAGRVSYLASLGDQSDGVDIVSGSSAIRKTFPAFDPAIRHVVHIRRAGDLDSYQLSQHMLEKIRTCGGTIVRGEVVGIDMKPRFRIVLEDKRCIDAESLVIAAGPFVNRVLGFLGERLPVINTLQQKFAFEDVLQAIPVDQPFAVDLDDVQLDWTDDERSMLSADDDFSIYAGSLPGKVHRRVDAAKGRHWLRLGWAWRNVPVEPSWTPSFEHSFPELVLRAAARLNPALMAYLDRMPATRHHYGGYYTMTEDSPN
jgi:glycine/D-amino acid oxidase-like deaminating enzyme